MTVFLTKWTPFRLAQTLRCLQQGVNNVGNDFQNRAALLAAAIAQANTPSNPPWAKWRVGTNGLPAVTQTSGCALLINVPLVPGYVPPANTNEDEA